VGIPNDGRNTMQQRRGTKAQWESVNPVLFDGELGLESDTKDFKFGDGVTHWNNLTYAGGSTNQYLWLLRDRVSNLQGTLDGNAGWAALGDTTDLIVGHTYVPNLNPQAGDLDAVLADPNGWVNPSTCDSTAYWGTVFPAGYTVVLPPGAYACYFEIGVKNYTLTTTNRLNVGIDYCSDYSVSTDPITFLYGIKPMPPGSASPTSVAPNQHAFRGTVIVSGETQAYVPFVQLSSMDAGNLVGSRLQNFIFNIQRATAIP
jgi:hypothetical protein